MKKFLPLILGLVSLLTQLPLAQSVLVHHEMNDPILSFSEIEDLIEKFEDILDDYAGLAEELKDVKKDLKIANSAMETLRRQLAQSKEERDSMKEAYDKAMDFNEKLIRSEIYLKAEHERSKQDNKILTEMLDSKEQLTRHLNQMVEDYKKASKEFLKSLEKMRCLAFQATFRLAAKQEGRTGPFRKLGRKRITDRLPLNKENSYELQAKKVDLVYIEALCAEDEAILPDYYFTIEYSNEQDVSEYIFGSASTPLPLPTAGGVIDHSLKYHWKEGLYKVNVMYEEDEMMKPQITYYFKL